jgi:hypothetical protein
MVRQDLVSGIQKRCEMIPKTLYHYTNAKGLVGILSNKRIWATNISFLNDKTEFTHTIQMLKSRLESSILLPYCNKFLTELAEYTYVASFSAAGNLLSQWRGYCPIGGFSIGFDLQKLRGLSKELYSHGTLVELSECVYDENEKATTLAEIISESELHANDPDFLFGKISRIAPVFKDRSFCEEQEWRMVITLMNFKLQFREGKTGTIPYYEVPLEQDSDVFPVTSITVGPTPNLSESLLAVELLLKKCHLYDHVQVSDSGIPYRDI